MELKFKKFIGIWNHNIHLVHKSRISINRKDHKDLFDFCVKDYPKNYKSVPYKGFILFLDKNSNTFKKVIKDFNEFKNLLCSSYHKKYNKNESKNRKFVYSDQINKGYEIEVEREIIIEGEQIIFVKKNSNELDRLIVQIYCDEPSEIPSIDYLFENNYFLNNKYKFIFFQLSLYNNSPQKIKKWLNLIEKNKLTVHIEKKTFLHSLTNFFNERKKLKSEFEKTKLWANYYSTDNLRYEFFEEFFEEKNKHKYGEYLISIFKDEFLISLISDFKEKKSASINKNDFIKDQIKEYKDVLNKPNKFSFRPNQTDYNKVYLDLIKGDRVNYYNISNSEIAGKAEAIQEFIRYLEGLKITNNRNKVFSQSNSNKTSLFPIEIFDNTRGYLKKNAQQILTCYNHKAYDACSILLRKVTEILIIELYEKEEIEEKIQNEDGNYFMLKKLIISFQNEKKFKKLISRGVTESLPKIKKSGDRSAHNRKYNARKHDIDLLRDDFRIVFEEFINSVYT